MEKSIIVIAEHFEGRVRPITYELVACALKLRQSHASSVKVIILGADVSALAREIADSCGQEVIAVQVPELIGYNGEIYRSLLGELLLESYPAYVCVAHTSQGLDFAPALAVVLKAACITGVENIRNHKGQFRFIRPLYGGKLVAHIRLEAPTVILTLQPGAFKPVEVNQLLSGKVDIKLMPFQPRQSRSMGLKQTEADVSGITEADVIVAAGQGIGGEENLDLIYQLARLFPKAAVAGSRIVCDLGWLQYRCQVGVTGATVSPHLYIACGISGAVQHITGMRGSGFIVAINTDPTAAIFQVADICIVEDLTTFIPTMIEEYKKSKKVG